MNPHTSARNFLSLARLSGIDRVPVTHRPSGSEENDAPPDCLSSIFEHVSSCTKCTISSDINNYVFGEGNPSAECMFIGEAPGRDEDIQGHPFVGRAGQLLTDIITKGMKLSRKDVYIANILKCRPPENRNPLPGEITNCIGYLHAQIECIRPKVIIALGTFAAQTLLNTSTPISRLRGSFHSFRDIPLMPTYHPAYLLRNSSGKASVWEDIKKVMDLLGLPVT